jgi:polar amino acid transport system permease protein
MKLWDWGFALECLPMLGQGLLVTLQVTSMATAIFLSLGLVIALMQRSCPKWINVPFGFVTEFIRRTPLLVQLYFVFFVLPEFNIMIPPLTAGFVVMGIHYSTYAAMIYGAGIDNVDRGQWDASTALNYSRSHVWVHIILPQAIPPMIPALANLLIGMFKESALLTAITVMELMGETRLLANENYRYYEPMTLAGLIYLSISVPAALATKALERRLGSV